MRSEPLPSDIPLPARDPRGPWWNPLRSARFFSHALPAHPRPSARRPRPHPSPAIESPRSSPARSSKCVAGNSFHIVKANNLAKLATSRPVAYAQDAARRDRSGFPALSGSAEQTEGIVKKHAKIEKGSGNVFLDLGFPPDEAHNLLIRSDLMIEIKRFVQKSGLTQKEAAKRLGLTQPRLNDLLRGKIASSASTRSSISLREPGGR